VTITIDAATRYQELLAELRELTIKIHGGELFAKKPDTDLLAALEEAGRALKKAKKVAA
jgi:ribosome-associated translation inhibitor RaiA